MSMKVGGIVVTISAKDELSSALAMIGSSLGQLGGIFQPIGNIIQGFAAGPLQGIVTAATEATKALIDMVGTAVQFEPLANAFDQLREGSSLSLAALQEAARGTVSEIDLVRAANTAMALGIDPDLLPRMMEMARSSAQAMGISVSQAFEDLARGMGRKSKMILDNLGYILNLDTAYQRYADTLGKTVSELTDAEKTIAFNNEVMRVGEEQMEKLGEQGRTTKDMFARIGATVEDAKTAFGGFIMEALRPIIDLFALLANLILPPLKEGFKFLANILKGVWAWFEKLWSIVLEAVMPVWEELQKACAILWDAINELLEPLKGAFGEFDLLGAIMKGVAQIIVAVLVPMIQGLIWIIQRVTDFVHLLKKAWDEDWGGIRSTLETIWENFLKPILSALCDFLGSDKPWSLGWTIKKLREGWENAWNAIKNTLDRLLGPIKSGIQGVIDVIKFLWDILRKLFGHSPGGEWEKSFEHALTTAKRYSTLISEAMSPTVTFEGVGGLRPTMTPFGPAVTQMVTISVEAKIGGGYDVRKLARDLKGELDALAYRSLRARARPGVVWE